MCPPRAFGSRGAASGGAIRRSQARTSRDRLAPQRDRSLLAPFAVDGQRAAGVELEIGVSSSTSNDSESHHASNASSIGMVRRENTEPTEGRLTGKAVSRCIAPAGESPVRVIAGEPGSRPAPEAERPDGEAWCRKPSAAKAVHGEQLRGPQHQVKPAA